MQKQDAVCLLNERIHEKEAERIAEKFLLQAQFKMTMESLKPINLIKEAFTSSESKNTVVDTAIGISSGYLAKKTIVRSSKNPLLKLLGTIVGIGVANVMTKHPDGIKSIGGTILNSVFKKRENDIENE